MDREAVFQPDPFDPSSASPSWFQANQPGLGASDATPGGLLKDSQSGAPPPTTGPPPLPGTGQGPNPVFDPTTGTWSIPGGASGLTIGQLAASGLATAGFPGQFNQGPFQAPTAAEALNDPGYQFRLQQGADVLDRSAAGRGLLGSSGTLQDIMNYGQNAASQEYQNVYARDLGTYNTNYGNAWQRYLSDLGIFTGTQDRNFNKTLEWAQA